MVVQAQLTMFLVMLCDMLLFLFYSLISYELTGTLCNFSSVYQDFVLKLLEDKGCPTPTSISMHKSEVCSAGLLRI